MEVGANSAPLAKSNQIKSIWNSKMYKSKATACGLIFGFCGLHSS